MREYYPAALEAFEDLAHGDALSVSDRASTPEQAARLSLPALQSALKRDGRQRNIVALARQIQAPLRSEQPAAPAQVTAAFAAATRATVGIIAELNHQISKLETSLAEHFETHPDAVIYRSLPRPGVDSAPFSPATLDIPGPPKRPGGRTDRAGTARHTPLA